MSYLLYLASCPGLLRQCQHKRPIGQQEVPALHISIDHQIAPLHIALLHPQLCCCVRPFNALVKVIWRGFLPPNITCLRTRWFISASLQDQERRGNLQLAPASTHYEGTVDPMDYQRPSFPVVFLPGLQLLVNYLGCVAYKVYQNSYHPLCTIPVTTTATTTTATVDIQAIAGPGTSGTSCSGTLATTCNALALSAVPIHPVHCNPK